jgi:PelA/Pel-15E family pectate lyase
MTPRLVAALVATAAAAPAWSADGPARYLVKPDAWFASDEGKKVADNVLSYQAEAGGWAQHDEKDFRPRPGRTYELVSLSGAESVGVVELLMSIEKPSPEIVRAVEGAVAWFEAAKLTGIRQTVVEDSKGPRGRNKAIIAEPKASPLWARFYEIGTNKPLFADRDGVAKYALADIGYERRNGYAWYSTWPAKLLADDYRAWKKRVAGGK